MQHQYLIYVHSFAITHCHTMNFWELVVGTPQRPIRPSYFKHIHHQQIHTHRWFCVTPLRDTRELINLVCKHTTIYTTQRCMLQAHDAPIYSSENKQTLETTAARRKKACRHLGWSISKSTEAMQEVYKWLENHIYEHN